MSSGIWYIVACYRAERFGVSSFPLMPFRMQLEKLYNLPKPPSPRPALQRSSSSSGRARKQSKSFTRFQAAA